MRFLKLIIFSIWLASLMFIWLAYAETCVGGGPLSIASLPSGLNFSTTGVSLTDTSENIAFTESLVFQDLRGELLGFSLTVKNTDFAEYNSGYNSTFDLSNLKIATDDNDTIGLVECDDDTGLTLSHPTYSAFADSNEDGISDEKALVVGDVRERIGKYSIEPDLEIIIPGKTSKGNYQSTLTFTIS